MTSVLLATCDWMPEGEPGGGLLVDAFAAAGADARWVRWDDAQVDWTVADVVAVRATWDYAGRLGEFLPWARSVGPALLNGAVVFEWNTDKRYLVELAEAGLPVVPTLVAEGEGDLPSAIAAHDRAVVKPSVGAGGRGVVVFDGPDDGPWGLDQDGLGRGPWVVQPLVESVRTEGEHSVFVLGGDPVAQVRKVPAGEDIRVHEHYGGSTTVVDLDPVAAGLARRTVAVAESILGSTLSYARVDLLRMPDGTLVVSELEVTEPGLYLDVLPQNAEHFVTATLDWLGSRSVRS
jgi:glutathione synthase/RimK-type ligase-like ATP-grasp enzyme